MRTSADEVVWTCSEVIEMDAENAKAYYRRAMAYVEMESSRRSSSRSRRQCVCVRGGDAIVPLAAKNKTELERRT